MSGYYYEYPAEVVIARAAANQAVRDSLEAAREQIRELTRQRDDARDLAVRSGIFESWQALTQHDDETGD